MGCLIYLIGCFLILIFSSFLENIGLEFIGYFLFIIWCIFIFKFFTTKKCPYCKSTINIEIDNDWTYCKSCHNPIKIKNKKIFILEEKLPLGVHSIVLLLFIMEYTNLNFPINNEKRNNIYNFIIRNFKLSTKQQAELQRICKVTLIHGNWDTLAINELTNNNLYFLCNELTNNNLYSLCDAIQKDTSKIYDRSIIGSIFNLFNKKENKFADGLRFKYKYESVINSFCKLIIQELSDDITENIRINSVYNNIDINKFKKDLLEQILKIIGWNSGKISDVQSYMVKLYIEKFDILLEDFINLTEDKQSYQNNDKNKDITLDDSYDLLNVDRNSSKEEIINSYNHLMKVYDVSTIDLPDELKKDFYAKREKIQQAYELIIKVCR